MREIMVNPNVDGYSIPKAVAIDTLVDLEI